MASDITIFKAKKIVTMNPTNPEGTHVAVREGKILGVGTLDEVQGWGAYTLDETFKDKVLIPGLVEVHSHASEGASWLFPYIGYFDRMDPDGKVWPGCKTLDAFLARLREIEAEQSDPNSLLLVWGMDPVYYEGDRLSAHHLDKISTTRPIFVYHANGHVATINRRYMQQSKITRDTQVTGVLKNANGEPNGELSEFAAMGLTSAFPTLVASLGSEQAIRNFGKLAVLTGVTTVTETGLGAAL
jgi:predicted amidohydrolase YtcJ